MQNLLLVFAAMLVVAGVVVIYWPAGIIALGLILGALAFTSEF